MPMAIDVSIRMLGLLYNKLKICPGFPQSLPNVKVDRLMSLATCCRIKQE